MSDHTRRFNLNLNLLPLLDALLECRSVTRAGERLNLSQPTASTALAKLRAAFDDELLVSIGREMRLTPKAERMRAPVHQLMELLANTFDAHDEDPRSWSGEFIVATTDVIAVLVLPGLMERINATAPKLTVRVTNMTRTSVTNLRAEEIDMIISPPEIVDDLTLMSRRLYGDRFVLLYSKDRPPTDSSLEEYMKRAHIATVIDAPQIGGAPRSYFSDEIDGLRTAQHNLAIVPYYSLLPLLVSDTAWLALVQERLAKKFMKILPVAYMDPPSSLPKLDLHMFWSPRVNDDPRHVWLRNAIVEVCEQYR